MNDDRKGCSRADYQKVLDIALSLEKVEKSVQGLWGGTKLNKWKYASIQGNRMESRRPQLKEKEVLVLATGVEV